MPLVNDLGSGTLVDLVAFGLAHEPTVAESVADGADLVTFSGDKLLGGPQTGFIVGRKDLIAQVNRNPMKRALRVDKIRLAALEATLKLYRDPDRLIERLPTIRPLARPRHEIERRLRDRLLPVVGSTSSAHRLCVTVTDCASQIGSGALPTESYRERRHRDCADVGARQRGRPDIAERGVPAPANSGDWAYRGSRLDLRPALPR